MWIGFNAWVWDQLETIYLVRGSWIKAHVRPDGQADLMPGMVELTMQANTSLASFVALGQVLRIMFGSFRFVLC